MFEISSDGFYYLKDALVRIWEKNKEIYWGAKLSWLNYW